MQSFLQYRRFRATVEAQLERDQAKADSYRTPGGQRPTTQPRRTSVSSDESKHDLEKGVDRGDFATQNHPPHPESQDLEASTTKKQEADMVAEQRKFEEPAEDPPRPEEEDDDDDDDDDYELRANRTITRTTSQMSAGNALGTILTGVEVRRRTTREGGDGNVFVVGYEGVDDPNDPQ